MVQINNEPAPPERALVISAHPDDIEFVCAGTVAKWVRAGSEVRYVVATSGDAGTHQRGITRQELAEIREAEQRAASRTYARSGYYRDHHYAHRCSNYGREREEMSQRQMANRYATLASIKRKKADRLERAAAQPGQIIHGHDGDVIFTLRTKYSLSTELENISIGDTITWAGTRVSADGDSETWDISSIRKLK